MLEKDVGLLALCVAAAASIGGLTQIVSPFFQDMTSTPVEGTKPYAAPQPKGRDIHTREDCVDCHSQMIHPFRAETKRYGHYSVVGESVQGHPFLWGSKRTGPDLARVGSHYSDDWHRAHLFNPRGVVPESKIPAYPWLVENRLNGKDIEKRLKVIRTLGVPYTDEDIKGVKDSLKGKTEMDTVVAYLQMLDTLIKNKR